MGSAYRDVMTNVKGPVASTKRRRGWWPDQTPIQNLWSGVLAGGGFLGLAVATMVAFADWQTAMAWSALGAAFFAGAAMNAARPEPGAATVVYRVGHVGLAVGVVLLAIAHWNS